MQYENSISMQVYGRYALFSDPITRVGGEKFSYPVPTYQALKGIYESCYWKPTFTWVIDELRVMNPIERQSKGIRPIMYNNGKNDLSIYTYLSDVCYQVRAHFEWNEHRPDLEKDRNENKHYAIAKRMLERGGRRDIFLGTRECQGYIEPCIFGLGKGHYDDVSSLDLGLMEHGITYADENGKGVMQERFWHPIMGMKHRVAFGVYTTFGSINCQLAEKTGFTDEDAEIIKETLRTLFENDSSSARPDGSMEVVRLYWWRHNCKSGQYSSAKVHRCLHVELKESVEQAHRVEDYNITCDTLNGLTPEVYDEY